MEANGSQWKLMEANGSQWKPMEANESLVEGLMIEAKGIIGSGPVLDTSAGTEGPGKRRETRDVAHGLATICALSVRIIRGG
jgi:hypothetical protein